MKIFLKVLGIETQIIQNSEAEVPMQNSDLAGFRVYEGELQERELYALRAMVLEGLNDETDAHYLYVSLDYSLSKFDLVK